MKDEEVAKRPATSTTDDNIEKSRVMIVSSWGMSIDEQAQSCGEHVKKPILLRLIGTRV